METADGPVPAVVKLVADCEGSSSSIRHSCTFPGPRRTAQRTPSSKSYSDTLNLRLGLRLAWSWCRIEASSGNARCRSPHPRSHPQEQSSTRQWGRTARCRPRWGLLPAVVGSLPAVVMLLAGSEGGGLFRTRIDVVAIAKVVFEHCNCTAAPAPCARRRSLGLQSGGRRRPRICCSC